MANINTEPLLGALALPRAGHVYDLSVSLGPGMPKPPIETFSPFSLSHYHLPRALVVPEADPPPFDYAMDVISGSPHLGTHIDGLAHIACRGQFYGETRVAEAYTDFGWHINGIENAPPIVARAVLADVAGLHGVDALEDRYEVTQSDLEQIFDSERIAVRPGDVVLVRTGKIREYKSAMESFFAEQPGVGQAAGLWLASQGIQALGTDTSGSEPHPIGDHTKTLHEALLVRRGIYLIEIMDLDALAAEHVYEFLFVCLPLRIDGATGSWVRPIAIV